MGTTSEEIKQGLAEAGWEIDDGFSRHLVIGYSGDNLSILFYPEMWRVEDPMFEVLDHVKNVIYWVREIPAPRQAKALLEEHGEPPEEERGNPYEWWDE